MMLDTRITTLSCDKPAINKCNSYISGVQQQLSLYKGLEVYLDHRRKLQVRYYCSRNNHLHVTLDCYIKTGCYSVID